MSPDGIVGGCVTEHGEDGIWTVRLLMMSCRAMGRGVIDVLLAWLIRSTAGRGARADGSSAASNIPSSTSDSATRLTVCPSSSASN